MKNQIIYSVIIFIVLSGLISNVDAQRRFRDKDGMPTRNLIEKLNLTDTQKEKFDEFRFNHQKSMIDLRADLQQKLLELNKYKSGGNLNRSKVISLTKEINEIRNKMALARANHQMDIYELLDDTQRKIWQDNMRMRSILRREKGMLRNWSDFCPYR